MSGIMDEDPGGGAPSAWEPKVGQRVWSLDDPLQRGRIVRDLQRE